MRSTITIYPDAGEVYDFDNFLHNPVLIWNHDNNHIPVGKVVNLVQHMDGSVEFEIRPFSLDIGAIRHPDGSLEIMELSIIMHEFVEEPEGEKK